MCRRPGPSSRPRAPHPARRLPGTSARCPGSVPAAGLRAGRGVGGSCVVAGEGTGNCPRGLEDPHRGDAGREAGEGGGRDDGCAAGGLPEVHPPPSRLSPGLGAALTFRSLAHARTELAHKVAGGGGAALALLPAPSLPSLPPLLPPSVSGEITAAGFCAQASLARLEPSSGRGKWWQASEDRGTSGCHDDSTAGRSFHLPPPLPRA